MESITHSLTESVFQGALQIFDRILLNQVSLLLYAIHSNSKIWDLRWRSLVSLLNFIAFPQEHSICRYISHLANVSFDSHLRENPTKTYQADSMSSSAIAYFQKVNRPNTCLIFTSTVECRWRRCLAHDLQEGFPYVWNFTKTLPQEIRLCSNVAEKHGIFQMKPIIKKKIVRWI